MENTFYDTIGNLYELICKDGNSSVANKLWHVRHPGKPLRKKDKEYKSWVNSLPKLITDIHSANLDNLDLIMEYETPLCKRIDAILVGNDHSNNPQILIIENKQWSNNNIRPDDNYSTVKVNIGRNGETKFQSRAHPLQQLETYRDHMLRNHSALNQGKVKVLTAGYLHNLNNLSILYSGVYSKWADNHMNKCLYGSRNHSDFKRFLRNNFSSNANHNLTDKILNGSYGVGKADINEIKNIMNKHGFFIKNIDKSKLAPMIADQIPINAFVEGELKKQLQRPHKELIVISGDAGTGKTILGFYLLYDLYRLEKKFHYKFNTKNAVYTLARNKTVNRYIKGDTGINIPYTQNIINHNNELYNKYKRGYIQKYLPTGSRLFIIDEAHRMSKVTETLNQIFNSGCDLVVILQDDHQLIEPGDNGSTNNFKLYVKQSGISSYFKKLQVQKRNKNGDKLVRGDSLTHALDYLFDNNTKPINKSRMINIKICDDLNQIENKLWRLNQKKFNAKWIAPFCWGWNTRNNSTPDIRIRDHNDKLFQLRWNPQDNYYNPQYRWLKSHDLKDLNRAACIYTTQGLEFDYTGFIWWDDLYWDDHFHKWEIRYLADNSPYAVSGVKDGSYKKYKIRKYYGTMSYSQQKDIVTQLVKNTYEVLLTRAQRGMFIWFKDPVTKKHVQRVLNLKK